MACYDSEVGQEPDVWSRLTSDLVQKVAAFMHPADAATALKLVNKATAESLRSSFFTVRLLGALVVVGDGRGSAKLALPVAADPWPGNAFLGRFGRPEAWRGQLSLPQCRRLLCLAASSHHAPSLEAALAYSGVGLGREVISAAAAAGDLAACKRLVQEGCCCNNAAVDAAARRGHLHILQWMWWDRDPQLQLSHAFDMDVHDVAKAACAAGQLHVLTWLEQGLPPPTTQASQEAPSAEVGQQGQTQQAAGKEGETAAPEDAARAVRSVSNTAETRLQAPFLPFPHFFTKLVQLAASNGHMELLQRLLDPNGRYIRRIQDWGRRSQAEVLSSIALGCPLETLQRYWAVCAPVERDHVHLAKALLSRTPDWQAKTDFILSRWGLLPSVGHAAEAAPALALAAARVDTEAEARQDMTTLLRNLLLWRRAAAVADFVPRWRYLTARVGVEESGMRRELACALAGCGEVEELKELMDGGHLEDILAGQLACEAADNGHVPVLQLLRERHGSNVITLKHVSLLLAPSNPITKAEGLVEALARDEGFRAAPTSSRSKERKAWSQVFRGVAMRGGGLPVLRLLHEARGAAVHLAAMVKGGTSLAALDWALGVLQEQGRVAKAAFDADGVWRLANRGDLAAPGWLLHCGLVTGAGAAAAASPGAELEACKNGASEAGGSCGSSKIPCARRCAPGVLPFPQLVPDWETEDVDGIGSVQPPINCLRFWVLRLVAGAAAGRTSPGDWAQLDAFIAANPFERTRLQPHQRAWLRRQRVGAAQNRMAALGGAMAAISRTEADAELVAAQEWLQVEDEDD